MSHVVCRICRAEKLELSGHIQRLSSEVLSTRSVLEKSYQEEDKLRAALEEEQAKSKELTRQLQAITLQQQQNAALFGTAGVAGGGGVGGFGGLNVSARVMLPTTITAGHAAGAHTTPSGAGLGLATSALDSLAAALARYPSGGGAAGISSATTQQQRVTNAADLKLVDVEYVLCR